MRESWLNGWCRNGPMVLIGSGACCVGCGRLFGVACVAFTEDFIFPEKTPDWPFHQIDCPVCSSVKIDLLEITPTEDLRKEITKRMKKIGMK